MGTNLNFTVRFVVFVINILILLTPTIGIHEAYFTSVNLIYKNDTSFMNAHELRIKKVNRTMVMIAVIEYFEDVGNDYKVTSCVFKKAGNQYRKTPYKHGPFTYCQYFLNNAFFVQDMRKVSSFPPKEVCPWPKGNYTIDGFSIKLDNIPPVFQSGDYMLETQISKDGKLINGIQFHVKLENI